MTERFLVLTIVFNQGGRTADGDQETIRLAVAELDVGRAVHRLEGPMRPVGLRGRGGRAQFAVNVGEVGPLPLIPDPDEGRARHGLKTPLAAVPFRLDVDDRNRAGGLIVERRRAGVARGDAIGAAELELLDRGNRWQRGRGHWRGRRRRDRLHHAGRGRRELCGRCAADVDRHRLGRRGNGIEAFFRFVGHNPGMAGGRGLPQHTPRLDQTVEFAIAVGIDPVEAQPFGGGVAKRQFDGAAGLHRFQAALGAAVERLSRARRG